MYNPEELKLEQGNTFAEVGIPGLNAPPVQYVRGKARALTMELFFDSYETGEDVRDCTAPIVRLLDRQPLTRRRRCCSSRWAGSSSAACWWTPASGSPCSCRDGTPVRSTHVASGFRNTSTWSSRSARGLFFGSPTVSAAVNTAAARRRSARSLAGAATVHVTAQGDTLSGLADRLPRRSRAGGGRSPTPTRSSTRSTCRPAGSLVIPPPAAREPGARRMSRDRPFAPRFEVRISGVTLAADLADQVAEPGGGDRPGPGGIVQPRRCATPTTPCWTPRCSTWARPSRSTWGTAPTWSRRSSARSPRSSRPSRRTARRRSSVSGYDKSYKMRRDQPEPTHVPIDERQPDRRPDRAWRTG